MKIKILLWSVVSILIIGLAAGAYWWLSRPQVITFNDDARVTLLAVQYGKRHAPPTVKASSTPAARAPARGRGSFTTTNDTLVLWVRQQYDASGNQYHSFQYYVYDKANTACVQTYSRNYSGGNQRGNDVVAVQFSAFPRRQGKLVVRVQEQGNGGQEMSEQKFVISNPARDSFAKWTAEPLPTTKEDDDLSVTLKKLTAGANLAITRNQDNPDDPANKGAEAVFRVERNGKPVSNWEPVSVETSDATGNQLTVNKVNQNGWQNGWAQNAWANDEDKFAYQYALWPDEPAWKIKVEFSQQSDFSPGEIWTAQNVPVQPGRQQDFLNFGGRPQATNSTAAAETDLNGFHLKVFPARQFTDVAPNNWMQGGLIVQVSPDVSKGYRMNVKVTDDQNNEVQMSDYGTTRNNNLATFRYQLRDINGLTNLNVVVAIHKSRFVEFTAKATRQETSNNN
jgi:hypothetical protein